MNAETGLVLIDRARAALTEARSVDEVKTIRDQAQAVQAYLKTQRAGFSMQNDAAEIKLRAERRLGEMLGDMEKHPGGDPRPSNTLLQGSPAKLADLGIGRMDSSRWQKIADLPTTVFEHYISTAKNNKELTTVGLVALARDRERTERGKQPPGPLPAGLFTTIVADPPWAYEDATARGAALHHYGVMSVEAVASLAVREHAAEDAHLYLWVTNPHLPIVWPVIEAWGFEYKTMLTWVKPQFGTGRYFRGATEHVLFCTRGNLPLRERGLSNWFQADRRKHSEKPDEFYDLVERASHGPYLELFARGGREGWQVWGDQA